MNVDIHAIDREILNTSRQSLADRWQKLNLHKNNKK